MSSQGLRKNERPACGLSLAGEFSFDVPLDDAFAACAEAIERLGWPIYAGDLNHIVSYAETAAIQHPPKIEVELTESGQSTDVRITGTDFNADPGHQDALIAELDRVRDAIKASTDAIGTPEAEATPQAPLAISGGNGRGHQEVPDSPKPKTSVKICPDCAEEVQEAASVCRFCGYRFDMGGGNGGVQTATVAGGGSRHPITEQKRTSRWRRRLVVGLASLFLLGAAGVGAALKIKHDNAVAAEQRAAAAKAKQRQLARAAITDCKQQLKGLDNALTDLSSRLYVGLNYGDYGTRVGDAQVAYGRTDFTDLSVSCVNNAGVALENALNDYTSAARVWDTCFEDLYCSDSQIEGTLQDKWAHADAQIQGAHEGYSEVTPSGGDAALGASA